MSLERVKAALRPPHLLPEGVSWQGEPSKVAAGSLLDRSETTRWARTQENGPCGGENQTGLWLQDSVLWISETLLWVLGCLLCFCFLTH